jgi:hypothetical protein
MTARLVHKVPATLCGFGRHADGLTGRWDETTCPSCLERHPDGPRRICIHCLQHVNGRCAFTHQPLGILHAETCVDAFLASSFVRDLRQRGIDPMSNLICPSCKRPLDHGHFLNPCPGSKKA